MGAPNEHHTETTQRSYDGPERRTHWVTECAQEERLANMGKKIEASAGVQDATLKAIQDLDHKLFHCNGKDALIPEIRRRLEKIEEGMLPHDDVKEMWNAFKVGKNVLMTVVLVAIVGSVAAWFWHLFSLNTPIQKVTP